MIGGVVTAFRTLTVLPVPGKDAERMSSALPWFPLVGGVLGGVLYGAAVLVDGMASGRWPGGAAAAALVCGIMLTGAFHLDGLADWADGFGGGRDRQKTLAIMKDSSTGAFGVTALVVVLLIKWVSLARLASSGTMVWVIAACVVSRAMMVELSVWLPYARPEGGTGANIVEGARTSHRAVALLAALVLLVALGGPAGALALGAGWLACRGFGLWCRRRVGGITGDLLGAGNELVETLVLVMAALPGRDLMRYADWGILVG